MFFMVKYMVMFFLETIYNLAEYKPQPVNQSYDKYFQRFAAI